MDKLNINNLKEYFQYCKSIQGDLVRLEPFASNDVTPEYIGWLKDSEVTRFSNQRFKKHSLESCRDFLASFEASPNLILKIVLQDSNRSIGTMTVYTAVQHGTLDIGIMVGCRSAWNKGVGFDAWNTLLNWLLNNTSARKVTGGAMRCNLAMLRIMERSGMTLEAIRPLHEMLDGEPQDMVYFGKFSDQL